jgi:hypothetical protein
MTFESGGEKNTSSNVGWWAMGTVANKMVLGLGLGFRVRVRVRVRVRFRGRIRVRV